MGDFFTLTITEILEEIPHYSLILQDILDEIEQAEPRFQYQREKLNEASEWLKRSIRFIEGIPPALEAYHQTSGPARSFVATALLVTVVSPIETALDLTSRSLSGDKLVRDGVLSSTVLNLWQIYYTKLNTVLESLKAICRSEGVAF